MDFLDEFAYPFSLRFRIDPDGIFVFPIQSEIEMIALHTNQDYGAVYCQEGIEFGNNILVWNEDKMGWVFKSEKIGWFLKC